MLDSCIVIGKEIGIDKLSEAVIYNGIGMIKSRNGDASGAIPAFVKSLQYMEETPGVPKGYLTALNNNIADMHRLLGNYDAAINFFRTSISIEESGSASAIRLARAYTNLAELFIEQEKFADAALELGSAENLVQKPRLEGALFDVLMAWSRLHFYQGDLKASDEYLQKAAPLLPQVSEYAMLRTYHNQKAQLALASGDPASALEMLDESLNLRQKTQYDAQDLKTLILRANALHISGSDRVLATANEAIQILEQARAKASFFGDSKAGFFARFANFYRDAAAWNISSGDGAEDAFSILELSKARAFNDHVASMKNRSDEAPEWLSDNIENYSALMAKIEVLERGLINPEPVTKDSLLTELANAKTQLETMVNEAGATESASGRAAHWQPISLKTLQNRLPGSAVLIQYGVSDSNLVAVAISDRDIQAIAIPQSGLETTISESVNRFVSAVKEISAVNDIKTQGAALSRLLVEPFAAMLKGKDALIIVPDGPLNYLPFEALPMDDAWLIEHFTVKYSPSATTLDLLPENNREFKKQALLVANPNFGEPMAETAQTRAIVAGKLQPLPFTAIEARNIEQIFTDTDVLMGSEASEESLWLTDLRDYKYLHFATHGILNESMPSMSALALTPVDPKDLDNDGFLTSAEMIALPMNPKMAVLSGCETALGKNLSGEGMLGLQRAFLFQGASSVTVSLWNVYDQSTAIFMEQFYRELNYAEEDYNSWGTWLLRGIGLSDSWYGFRAGAMRQAKLTMLENAQYAHPVHWAGFVLIGK